MCLALCLAVLGGRCGGVQGGLAARDDNERVSPAEKESVFMKQYKEEELAAGDDLTPLQTPEERAELIKQGKDPDGKKPGSHRGRPFVHMEQMYVIQDPKMFQAIIKNPLVIVYNYAMWCGNCKSFHDRYKDISEWIEQRHCENKGTKMERALCGNYFSMAVMDVDEQGVVAVKKRENVNTLPCVRLYSRGKMVADCFKGNRNSDEILSWIKRHEAFLAEPKKIKRIASMGEWKKLTQRHELVVACFAREPVKASKVYDEFALAYNQIHVENAGSKYWAALVTDKALAKELGFKMPRVALFHGRKVQECPLAKKDIEWQALTTWMFQYEYNELSA